MIASIILMSEGWKGSTNIRENKVELLLFTDSDYPFGIFKLFYANLIGDKCCQHYVITNFVKRLKYNLYTNTDFI
jgi:hypothetical protein